MRVLFDGLAPVAYGQIYVTSRDLLDMSEAFAGQTNGLCGAAHPGFLFLMTGTHSGQVRFRIESHDGEPPPASEEWEDVVEASFLPRDSAVDLVPWGSGSLARLPLAGGSAGPDRLPVYRVQYCAAGMDEGRDPFGGHDPDELDEDDDTYLDQRPDRYLLRWWPEAPPSDGSAESLARPDRILRQTSSTAGYWHDWAAALPAPPTLWEQVEAEVRKRREQERRAEEQRDRLELRRWAGRPPSERLRRVRGNVQDIAAMDRDLVDLLAEADDATQRRIAVWAARRAFTAAGVAEPDWLAPVWVALDRGDPLPAGFPNVTALLTRIVEHAAASGGGLTAAADGSMGHPVERVATALPALQAACAEDALRAALEALWAAAAVTAGQDVLAEVRRCFPGLDRSGD